MIDEIPRIFAASKFKLTINLKGKQEKLSLVHQSNISVKIPNK